MNDYTNKGFAKISQKETYYEKLYVINNEIWLSEK